MDGWVQLSKPSANRLGTAVALHRGVIIHPGADDPAGVSDAGRPATERHMPISPTLQDDLAEVLRAWTPAAIDAATGLPPSFYTDSAVFALERQRFFARTWLFIAHESDLPAGEGWYSATMAGFPVLLTRARDGRVRAFHNVCPHRGSPLGSIGDVSASCGAARTIACPYHGWVFGLDGSLAGAPGMDQAPGFDRGGHALRELRCDRWGPFIFVNVDGAAAPLAEQLGPAVPRFAGAQLDKWVRVHRVDYDCRANWKFYVENNAEYYHEPTAHHSSYNTKEVSWNNSFPLIQPEVSDFCYLQRTPYREGSREISGGMRPNTVMPGLDEAWRTASSIFQFWPNFAWILNPNLLVLYWVDPISPVRTRIRWDWMVPDTPEARAATNLEPLITLYDAVQKEDIAIFERLQVAAGSPAFSLGRLHPKYELGLHRFQALLMEHLTGRR
jgi:phenylpropionate dioxygenase-like ring-hydroxylating dioxygenase large terminal subunit